MVEAGRDRVEGRGPNDAAKAQQVSGSSQQRGPHLGIGFGLWEAYHVQLQQVLVNAIVCEHFITHH